MKCQHCGVEHQGNFCPNCGMPANSNIQQPPQQQPVKANKRTGCALLSVLVGVLFVYSVLSNALGGGVGSSSVSVAPSSNAIIFSVSSSQYTYSVPSSIDSSSSASQSAPSSSPVSSKPVVATAPSSSQAPPTPAPAPREEEPAAETPISASYIANSNTGKFHYASCSSVRQMKDSNKVPFTSRDAAVAAGYIPCKKCNP